MCLNLKLEHLSIKLIGGFVHKVIVNCLSGTFNQEKASVYIGVKIGKHYSGVIRLTRRSSM